MDTATQEPPKPAEGHGSSGHAPVAEPIDPEHDIDTGKTVFWLSSALIFVVICLVVLWEVFSFSIFGAQYRKIDEAPTYELRQIRSAEDFYLRKMQPEVDERSLSQIDESIEESTTRIIQAYIKK